jgi:hypothetical protein
MTLSLDSRSAWIVVRMDFAAFVIVFLAGCLVGAWYERGRRGRIIRRLGGRAAAQPLPQKLADKSEEGS